MLALLSLARLTDGRVDLPTLSPNSPRVSIAPVQDWGATQPANLFPGYALSQGVYVRFPGNPTEYLRAQVCAPDSSLAADLSWATRVFARVWELDYLHLGLDVPVTVEGQTVHILLRPDGTAGGEQVLTHPPGDRANYPWCAIYLYQVPTLTAPAERWRELAHEYGHAVLPAWGPYKGPEAWSNGDLGERIATTWMYQALKSGQAKPEDAAGATAEDLLGYMQQKVWGEAAQFGQTGPIQLNDRGEAGYWAGIRLFIYAQQVLPERVFRRSFGLSGGQDSTGFTEAVTEALSEQTSVDLQVPSVLRGRPAWYPAGRLRPEGKVLARRDGWVRVVAQGSILRLTR